MTRRWIALLPIVTLLGLTNTAFAQDAPKPLLQTLFTNNDVNGWQTIGKSGKTSVVKDDTRPGTDKNVLKFDYEVAKGDLNVLYLPVNDNEIATAQSIRFSVKADYATTIGVFLQEKDGGRYSAMFHVSGGKWQNVVLAPSDFVLNRGENDPADPDGKLDLDQVQSAGITDVNQIFVQAGDQKLMTMFNVKTGAHVLNIGDFTVGHEPAPGAVSISDSRIDSFFTPQIGWLTAGNIELAAVSGKPLPNKGISASYEQAPDRLCALIRSIPPTKLIGKTGIHITLASEKPARIVFQLEEQGGGKYNTILSVPGGNVATPFSLKFSDLKLSEDSKDPNGKFDADKIYQLLVIDFTGMVDKGNEQNILSIGELRTE